LWFELATVTSQALEYDVITYTPYDGLHTLFWTKLNHYENVSVNYLKFKLVVTGATQINSVTRAHHPIYSD